MHPRDILVSQNFSDALEEKDDRKNVTLRTRYLVGRKRQGFNFFLRSYHSNKIWTNNQMRESSQPQKQTVALALCYKTRHGHYNNSGQSSIRYDYCSLKNQTQPPFVSYKAFLKL